VSISVTNCRSRNDVLIAVFASTSCERHIASWTTTRATFLRSRQLDGRVGPGKSADVSNPKPQTSQDQALQMHRSSTRSDRVIAITYALQFGQRWSGFPLARSTPKVPCKPFIGPAPSHPHHLQKRYIAGRGWQVSEIDPRIIQGKSLETARSNSHLAPTASLPLKSSSHHPEG
jgi:hypothetical protein